MSKNAAGGFAFNIDDWTRLDRFLILGAEGGTYYVGEGQLTRGNAAVVLRCVKQDGVRVVNRILDVSDKGLAPKNDQAIFALALCAKTGDDKTRSLAYKVMPQVCRTGTHLFQFVEAIDGLGGWGRGARNAVGRWYTEKDAEKLAYQLVKYRQRGGWTHRDVLRLAHPKPDEAGLLSYAVGKNEALLSLPVTVQSYERAKAATVPELVTLITDFNLPREAIPTEYVSDPRVLEALLQKMPATALLRNLGNLTKAGVIAPFSDGAKRAIQLLSDAESLAKARVHPMAVYLALMTYASGQGQRGSGAWTPVQPVVDALNDAFYATMGNVTPSGKRLLIVLDTSGSMRSSYSGGTLLQSPIAKAAAMALICARTESDYLIIGVDTQIQQVGITPSMRLDSAINEAARHGGGGTNLELPYGFLRVNDYNVDGIVLFTDSETWAGSRHAVTTLGEYRRRITHDVRNAVVSMTATGHSVGDPQDPLTLQVVGLDASLPNTLSAFMRGEF